MTNKKGKSKGKYRDSFPLTSLRVRMTTSEGDGYD
jgi:hypothetical protein